MSQIRLCVFGRVFGVGFRAWTQEAANRLGITGWVCNVATKGYVEILGQGSKEKLTTFTDLIRKGPPFAQVERVRVEWIKTEEKLDHFNIAY